MAGEPGYGGPGAKGDAGLPGSNGKQISHC